MVEALLNGGADPAALDRNGQTAIHLCCEYDQRDCMSVLLSRSSSSTCLEIRNYEGKLQSTDVLDVEFAMMYNACTSSTMVK